VRGLGQVLGLALGPEQEQAQVLEQGQVQEPALAQVQEPALAQERELGLHRQPSSRLTTIPVGLIIFSFSSIKTPLF